MADSTGRNPHPDFNQVEAARPAWDEAARFRFTRTVDPAWSFGDGANRLHDGAQEQQPQQPQQPQQQQQQQQRPAHVAIDPYEPGRPDAFNYKLLISAIVPRPIALISTRSADGTTTNLAPFSYFNVVGHDPPLFVVGFTSPSGAAKDTLRNVVATREAVINVVGEAYVEAANATSIDAPYGASEWDVCGLTPQWACHTVRCPRVREAVFSIEVKLDMLKDYESRAGRGKTGTLAVFEGTRFWVRQDALNEQKNLVDPAVLRPVSRLGGITYARTTEAFELVRPKFHEDLGGQEALEKLNESRQQ